MNRYERTYQGFFQFKHYRRSWAFPAEVERILLSETVELGKTVLQLYGGVARFGLRLDIDPATRPDIIGNSMDPSLPMSELRHRDRGSPLRRSPEWDCSPALGTGRLPGSGARLVVPYLLAHRGCLRAPAPPLVGLFPLLPGRPPTTPG
jgi:hypothetical protein